MEEKTLINSSRINGIELLLNKYISLTKRQVWGIYDEAVRQKLSYNEIVNAEIVFENPLADIGESFGIIIKLKKI